MVRAIFIVRTELQQETSGRRLRGLRLVNNVNIELG